MRAFRQGAAGLASSASDATEVGLGLAEEQHGEVVDCSEDPEQEGRQEADARGQAENFIAE